MMKKLMAMLLVLTMVLSGTALAAAAKAPATQTIDFGDFTLDIDPNMPGEVKDKVNNETMVTMYPAYNINGDASSNITVVWSEAVQDFSELDTDEKCNSFAKTVLDSIVPAYRQSGITVTNEQVLGSMLLKQDGVQGIMVVFSMDADYAGMGVDLKTTLIQLQVYLSDKAFGSYIFTGTSSDMDTLQTIIVPVLDSIQWDY